MGKFEKGLIIGFVAGVGVCYAVQRSYDEGYYYGYSRRKHEDPGHYSDEKNFDRDEVKASERQERRKKLLDLSKYKLNVSVERKEGK